MLLAFALAQGPDVVHVGRVAAVFWPGHEVAATSLAEFADAEATWPALSRPFDRPLRIILAPNQRVLDSLTEGRLPEWGRGVAFPGTNTIIVVAGREARPTLRHELAHLALRNAVPRPPRWLDEGYASWAAGEWGRLEALRVNWALARGEMPTLRQLSNDLRGTSGTRAEAAYALATTVLLHLARLGGERGLQPLLDALIAEGDIDRALRRTYQLTLGQFEESWQRDLKKRYGVLLLLTSVSIFWSIVAGLVFAVWIRRRRRDRERRAALDVGWIVETGEPPPAS